MGLITLLVYVLVIALVWWLVTGYLIPLLPAPFGQIVMIIFVLIIIVFVLSLIGVGPGLRL